MGDYIVRVSAAGAMVRGFFARTTETVGEAARIHAASPVVSAALGRLLTAGAIMGSMLKNDTDLTSLIIKGDGPMAGLVVSCGKNARVKGYPYYSDIELPLNSKGKLDVAGAIGAGMLSVVQDIGLKEAVSGQVKLVSGEIAEDLTHYFRYSEQIPSSVALGVLVDRDYSIRQAGGFIIQLMPGCPDSVAGQLEKALSELPPITSLMDDGALPEDIAIQVLGLLDMVELERCETCFGCNCNRDRVMRALSSLGREELENILQEDGEAVLHCHFCRSDYAFAGMEIKQILQGETM